MVQGAAPEASRDALAVHRDEPNKLLAPLSDESWSRIERHLEPVNVSIRERVWDTDTPIRRVVFPRTCVISVIVPRSTIGVEGLSGIPIVLGATSTRGRVTILDRSGLEKSPCECYAASWESYHRQLGLCARLCPVWCDRSHPRAGVRGT